MTKAVEELKAAGDPLAKDLNLKTFTRAKNTYYFPDAGYFASHTARALDPAGSTLIFFATLSGKPKHKQSDDLSVMFARGNTDLLIDGGTYNKEISDTVRNSARYDPASHSTFRVNGAGYALRVAKGARRAGLTGQWQGDGWAASRGFNEAYEDGRVERIAIHLKGHHAVIVFDTLASKTRRTRCSSSSGMCRPISRRLKMDGNGHRNTETSWPHSTKAPRWRSSTADPTIRLPG